ETQGALRAARRGVQLGRAAPRAARARPGGFPRARVRPGRRCGGRRAGPRGGARRARRRRARRRPRPAGDARAALHPRAAGAPAARPCGGLLPDGDRARARARPRPRPAGAPLQGHGDSLMRTVFINGRVLTDSGLEDGLAVAVEGERIAAVAPRHEVPLRGAEVVDLDGNLLLPGFIDIQVNGGGGVLFNDEPTVEAIEAIGRVHRRFGTTGFLPTLVSDDLGGVAQAIAATRDAIARGVPGVLGLHIEGPFLNEKRRGVHDASKIRELDDEAFELLTTPTGGKTLITLAPEKTTPAMIRAL